MKGLFRPDLMLKKYDDLKIDELRERGFDTILLDVDNTITPYDKKIPDVKAKAFVRELKEKGFRVIVFSNNNDKRVSKVAQALDCDYRCHALKPLPFRFDQVIKELDADKKRVLCMGDQLMTDVLGGNLAGIFSVYVKPIVDEDLPVTYINRKLERLVFKYILHEKV
ncbi:MAG: YqeG family HAD IIIA-type phosphatase [Erysipelotrichaceae bacterium]|nr:YqeG family HAD IIIA-type phosphatase [Erysipelotrichaceae bacterium]